MTRPPFAVDTEQYDLKFTSTEQIRLRFWFCRNCFSNLPRSFAGYFRSWRW